MSAVIVNVGHMLLQTQNLCVKFGSRHIVRAVDGISMDVHAGRLWVWWASRGEARPYFRFLFPGLRPAKISLASEPGGLRYLP